MSFNNLPIRLEYSDKIELIQRIITLYSFSISKYKMTKRNIDLLTLCFIYNMNDKSFRQKVINSGIGLNNETQINTELSRLRKANFLYKDVMRNDDHLSPALLKIKELIDSGNKVSITIAYEPTS